MNELDTAVSKMMPCNVCGLTTWSWPGDEARCFIHRYREPLRLSFGGSYPLDRNGHEIQPVGEWPQKRMTPRS